MNNKHLVLHFFKSPHNRQLRVVESFSTKKHFQQMKETNRLEKLAKLVIQDLIERCKRVARSFWNFHKENLCPSLIVLTNPGYAPETCLKTFDWTLYRVILQTNNKKWLLNTFIVLSDFLFKLSYFFWWSSGSKYFTLLSFFVLFVFFFLFVCDFISADS